MSKIEEIEEMVNGAMHVSVVVTVALLITFILPTPVDIILCFAWGYLYGKFVWK